MLIPLLVREISPARKARLLFGSSQDPTPGTICAYSSCAYTMASRLGFCAMAMVLLSFSMAVPPIVQMTQSDQLFLMLSASPISNTIGFLFVLITLSCLNKSAVESGILF